MELNEDAMYEIHLEDKSQKKHNESSFIGLTDSFTNELTEPRNRNVAKSIHFGDATSPSKVSLD